ncbi:hypothetical protein AX15_004436 [Amanita polypyramis BW_CC]|nr:hypothetical protein AX15_004436 [Amanita polypyramis BW_CC]
MQARNAHQLCHFFKDEFIRSFYPLYFAIVMGTGVVSILFYDFPYGQGLPWQIISLIIYIFNLGLFLVFLLWGIARYCLYPRDWVATIEHPTTGLFWGCLPMALGTLLTGATGLLYRDLSFGGKGFLYFIWAMWWVNVVIVGISSWGVLHFVMGGQRHQIEDVTLVWVLPVVPFIVASSTGSTVANALREYSYIHSIISVTVGAFIVIIGSLLCMVVSFIHLQRFFFAGPPAAPLTLFLPLGVFGQGGIAFVLLGQNFEKLLPAPDSPALFLHWPYAGQVLYILCICIAFMQWATGTMFLLLGFINLFVTFVRKTPIPFTLNYWGLIFPSGNYAILGIMLGEALNSGFFRVYGSLCATVTFLMWLFVSFKSMVYMYGAVYGQLSPASSTTSSEIEKKR